MNNEGKRVALIVACNSYSDPDLKHLKAPSQDAERFARILEDPKIGGFKVTTVIDQPHWIISQKLNELTKSCGKKDTLLLYFSCHGVKDEDGQLYFATQSTNRTLLDSTGVHSIFVNRLLDRCQAQQKVVLLDCCYSGSFEKGSITKADTQVNVAEFLGKGKVVITASDAMQYAFAGADKVENLGIGGSYFTNGLIKGLESGEADVDNDGKITYSELYRFVHDYVKSITPNQTPTLSTREVQGDFVVFRNMKDSLGSREAELFPPSGFFEDAGKLQISDPILGFIEEGKTFLENEQYDKAIKTFDGILMLRSGHIEALNGKGVALCRQKKYEEALECFQEVLKIKPKHAEASVYVDMITDRINKGGNTEVKSSYKDTKQEAELEKRTEEKVIESLNDSIQISTEESQYPQSVPGADSRNPYNDPTLPYYNPNLGKKGDSKPQKQISTERYTPQSVPGADSRNPYNDPTLPYYNPNLGNAYGSSRYTELPAEQYDDESVYNAISRETELRRMVNERNQNSNENTTTPSAVAFSPYTSHRLGFEIQYPSRWSITEEQNTVVFESSRETADIGSRAYVAVRMTPDEGHLPEQVAYFHLQEFAKIFQLSGIYVRPTNIVKYYPSVESHYMIIGNSNEERRYIYTRAGGKLIIIEFRAFDYYRNLPIADRMASSFHLV